MDLPQLQKTVSSFVETNELDDSVEIRLLDLVSEVGELSKEYIKGTNYGKEPFQPSSEWEIELGDVIYSLICVANNTSIDMEKALQKALDKYKKRLALKGDLGSEG